MLGKASEIKLQELKMHNVEVWCANHPDAQILDLKFAVSPNDYGYVLIIYKEAKEDE